MGDDTVVKSNMPGIAQSPPFHLKHRSQRSDVNGGRYDANKERERLRNGCMKEVRGRSDLHREL